MAEYTVLSDMSMYLVRYLREKLCPAPIASKTHIDLATPADPNPDYILGVYLYDVREEGDISSPSVMRYGLTQVRKTPMTYTLHYMLYINGSSQLGVKPADALKIIGKAAQAMNDKLTISIAELQPWLEEEEPAAVLMPSRIELEEKSKVWQAVDKPYQLSLFYKTAPVLLSSDFIREVPRVQKADITVSGMKRGEEP